MSFEQLLNKQFGKGLVLLTDRQKQKSSLELAQYAVAVEILHRFNTAPQ